MQRAGSLLNVVLKKRGLLQEAMAAHALHDARQWLCDHDPSLSQSVRFLSVKDGTLLIEAHHPIALQEIHALLGDLQGYLTPLHSCIQSIRVTRAL